MPEYRSIKFELHSQFDVVKMPEMDPLPQEHYTSRGVVCTVPRAIDEASSTRSVYVPVFPGSMFWIRYSVSPPVPDGHYFLFKLYINGTHIVNWSTGKDEGWAGKTMFGLYERPEDEEGRKKVEKRVLSFAAPDKTSLSWNDVKDPFDHQMRMEIKVHRAHGRMRIERDMEEYSKTRHAQNARGIHLVNAGRASSEQPKRFYKFALIDPVDQPFATFRYYYRTWEQLVALGFVQREWRDEGEDHDLPVIEPGEDTLERDDDDTADTQRRSSRSSQTNRSSADSQRLELRSATKPESRCKPSMVKKAKWRMRTSSPVTSIREDLSTPPLPEKAKEGGRVASLLGAISSTWKDRSW